MLTFKRFTVPKSSLSQGQQSLRVTLLTITQTQMYFGSNHVTGIVTTPSNLEDSYNMVSVNISPIFYIIFIKGTYQTDYQDR